MPIYQYAICGGFIVFDILTGYLLALHDRNVNSTKLREGLFHKLSEILALIGSNLAEYAMLYLDFGVDIPLFNAVAIYICISELVSILENLGELNPGLKKLYGSYLEKLHTKDGEEK